ncbi:MAG: hypothetical protein CR982_09735 [Candidatus Cloacimonadota bacterium]|nr:MAG: hypothetical protein CR982_09735 [Candidatus Cloacimonadota bacterium]PIE78186.1 MAG: hypothetical protein CSA15_09050 [Candidatus Delongbacteria bacterium]
MDINNNQNIYYSSESSCSECNLLGFIERETPLIIGERTNVSGSKLFKKFIRERDISGAVKIAKSQVRNGAKILDVNLTDSETDENSNIDLFYPELIKSVKVPVMVDSVSGANTIERALKYLRCGTIVNSVNLGNIRRFGEVVKVAEKYESMIVVLLIDQNGIAVSLEDKISVAKKSYKILVEEFGVLPSKIIFDCLVLPICSGAKDYYMSAKNSIDSIPLIKDECSDARTVLGVSNCSFGLPYFVRKILNSIFFHHAVERGLDMAIIDSENLIEYSSISYEERKLCENLIFNNSEQNIDTFSQFYSLISGC